MSNNDDVNEDVLLADFQSDFFNDEHVNKNRRNNNPTSLISNEKKEHLGTTNNNNNIEKQENEINKVIEEFKKLIDDCKEFQKNHDSIEIQTSQHVDEQLENSKVSTDERASDLWKKGTTLIMGDSIIAGLREYKMSQRKMIKVRSFPGARTNDMLFYSVPLLKKNPDKIIIHIGTNDAPHLCPDEMLQDLNKLRDMVLKYCPQSKIIISTPVLRTDKANSHENNIEFIHLLKNSRFDCIHHENILEEHI